MSNLLHRFQFIDSPVRGETCQLSSAYQEVLSRHEYPHHIAKLIGEILAATALMANSLKFEGSLIVQVQGDGPLSMLMAECNEAGELRAIAQYNSEASAVLHSERWTDWVGHGHMTLTIDPLQGERYQGIVPLEGETLAVALGHYFAQSEQLPTHFFLAADALTAAGLMLQVMPGHDNGEDDDLWPRVMSLASTLKADELLQLEPEDVLYRLFHEEAVEMFTPRALSFSCSCSRSRCENALRAISQEELREIAAEQGGVIEVDCQFCRQRYLFDRIDLEQLSHASAQGSDSIQ